MHLFWLAPADGKPADGLRTRTDGRGWVTFCNVPAGPRLLISVLLASMQPGPIQSACSVGRNEVLVREVRARRPTTAAERYQDTLANLPVCREVRGQDVPRPPVTRPPTHLPFPAYEHGRHPTAGQLFYIPATPHDSWVVGDEPYVSLHFLGAEHYAQK